MNIFLCGFMGCGKSTVGRLLARNMNMDFYDLDEYIVKNEGRSIPDIFSQDGEGYFRDLETKAIKSFADKKNCVIALGGGAVLRKENALAAKAQGEVVYIKADFDTCYKRICGDTNRPLASGADKESLEKRYNDREPVYSDAASVTVFADGTPEEIAQLIEVSVK